MFSHFALSTLIETEHMTMLLVEHIILKQIPLKGLPFKSLDLINFKRLNCQTIE